MANVYYDNIKMFFMKKKNLFTTAFNKFVPSTSKPTIFL